MQSILRILDDLSRISQYRQLKIEIYQTLNVGASALRGCNVFLKQSFQTQKTTELNSSCKQVSDLLNKAIASRVLYRCQAEN